MLSSDERERLQAIEAALRAEDPAFAQLLATGRPGRPVSARMALAALVTGFVGLVGGLIVMSVPLVLGSLAVAVVGGGACLLLSGAFRARAE